MAVWTIHAYGISYMHKYYCTCMHVEIRILVFLFLMKEIRTSMLIHAYTCIQVSRQYPWRESSKQHVVWYITMYVFWNFSFPIRASSGLCRKLTFGSNFQLAIDRHVRKDNDFSPWTGEDAHGSSILKHPSIKIIFSLFYLFLSSMWYEINKKTSNSMLFAKATFI